MHMLLLSIGANQARDLDQMKQEALRVRFEEQARSIRRGRTREQPVESTPASGLTPWREIVIPHPDVASGHFREAEFAADLSQVARGEAGPEYQNPRNFFQRTYLTDGLRTLLTNALGRLDGEAGGDPVVKLQTNFGGGKTHSMLALYHLFSGADPDDFIGMEPIFTGSGVNLPSQANRAVLVGTALSPAQPETKPDGTVVNTLWGDMAWQLLGKEGYAIVAEDDRRGTSPGSNLLRQLFREAEPSLVLIDEWVAYIRMLWHTGDLPAGTFGANISFAQSLTEAAKSSRGTLVVASLPASSAEIGGDAGQEALDQLANVFSRIEAIWRPADGDESYEIVRRRLFEPLTDPQLIARRDAVLQQMQRFYQSSQAEFPSHTREQEYRRRMEVAYPIHPELFDRLYEDWASLDRFQRTRGVLRLMALVIHVLWERSDASPLIMPGMMPIDDARVREELLRYLPLTWSPVVEKDVDGPNALPVQMDRENPGTFGRYAAARRVARTVYLGSAPLEGASRRGVDDRQVRLGSAQPNESLATFGDALRRMSERATYLYSDGGHYWYSTQPNVTSMARDRAASVSNDLAEQELISRLRALTRERDQFRRIHVAPSSASDVPDERELRLVIIDPEYDHSRGDEESTARKAVQQFLESRGSGPRTYRNALVFLAADQSRLREVKDATRQYLAWKSINDEHEELDLNASQRRQAADQLQRADERVEQQLIRAWDWLLVPTQPEPTSPMTWLELRPMGGGGIAERCCRRLVNDSQLAPELGAIMLRMQLDEIPLWRGNHVSVRQLQDDYAQYLYLERLPDSSVLFEAVKQGAGQLLWESEGFAYADRYNDQEDRYEGLKAGEHPTVLANESAVIIKPSIARAQLDAYQPEPVPTGTSGGNGVRNGTEPYDPGSTGGTTTIEPPAQVYTRFHGSIDLDNHLQFASRFSDLSSQILERLAAQPDARLRISIEIEADIPQGADEKLRRDVTEDAATLRLTSFEFE